MVNILLVPAVVLLVVLGCPDVSAFAAGPTNGARAFTTVSAMQQRSGIDRLCRLGVGIVGAAVLAGCPCFAEGRSGAEIFTQKCANCHKGGGNTVVGAGIWTLQSDALHKFGYDDVDKIIELLSKGKKIEADGRLMTDPGHPGYAGKSKKRGLQPGEIETISSYVLEQAEAGWPSGATATEEDVE